jgi:type VI protein secretion system component Hcp
MKKKKVGNKRGNRRRLAAKDLTTGRSKDVTGGKANFNDFSFVHKVDKASPVLLSS